MIEVIVSNQPFPLAIGEQSGLARDYVEGCITVQPGPCSGTQQNVDQGKLFFKQENLIIQTSLKQEIVIQKHSSAVTE